MNSLTPEQQFEEIKARHKRDEKYREDVRLRRTSVITSLPSTLDELHTCRGFLIAEVERLREALGMHLPWSLPSVVARLITGAEHLLHDHNCDQHGYEELTMCVERAKEYLVKIGHSHD